MYLCVCVLHWLDKKTENISLKRDAASLSHPLSLRDRILHFHLSEVIKLSVLGFVCVLSRSVVSDSLRPHGL